MILGQDASALVALPVLITGYLLGLVPGIIAGAVAYPLSLALLYLMGDPMLPQILHYRTIPPIVAMIAIGAVVGLFRDLEDRLREQLAERHRAEDELRVSEEKLRNLVEQSPDGIILINGQGHVVEWNRGQEAITGLSRVEVLGRPMWDVQWETASDAQKQHMTYEQVRDEIMGFAIRGTSPMMGHTVETQIQRPDGSQRTVQFRVFPIRLGADMMIGSISRDITEVKRAEDLDHRMAVAARLAEASEAERRRLARELHDQVGQNLTALSLNLSMLRSRITELDAEATGGACGLMYDRVDDSLTLIAQTMEQVRGVMADLRPPVLDEYGLLAALRWEGTRVSERAGLAIDVEGSETQPRLNPTVETALFRIAQEALNNVIKHAQATRVDVALRAEDGSVRMIVADNGVGFDPHQGRAANGDSGGWGLRTMIERAEAVGGHCRVESQPGKGTRVIVWASREGTDPAYTNGSSA
jgi:PAS domain S-box-containing protein